MRRWRNWRTLTLPKRIVPTDLEILESIYRQYYDGFAGFQADGPDRVAKIYVPVDLRKVAVGLGVDEDIVFGRLYYDMERRYGYKAPDGSEVNFFRLRLGDDKHCIHFPYMASVLAELQDRRRRYNTGTRIAAFSLAVAALSLWMSLTS